MATYQIRTGDTITTDPSAMTKRDGTAPNGTGGSARFHVEAWDGTVLLDNPATISTPNPLALTYTFTAADFGTGKLRKTAMRASWVFTYSTGIIETFPTAPDDLILVAY